MTSTMLALFAALALLGAGAGVIAFIVRKAKHKRTTWRSAELPFEVVTDTQPHTVTVKHYVNAKALANERR